MEDEEDEIEEISSASEVTVLYMHSLSKTWSHVLSRVKFPWSGKQVIFNNTLLENIISIYINWVCDPLYIVYSGSMSTLLIASLMVVCRIWMKAMKIGLPEIMICVAEMPQVQASDMMPYMRIMICHCNDGEKSENVLEREIRSLVRRIDAWKIKGENLFF